MAAEVYFVLRVKDNKRESDKAWMSHIHNGGDISGHRIWMRKFSAGKYLSLDEVGWEDNFGPGPSYSWEPYKSVTCATKYETKKAAQEAWLKKQMADIFIEVLKVEITLTVL